MDADADLRAAVQRLGSLVAAREAKKSRRRAAGNARSPVRRAATYSFTAEEIRSAKELADRITGERELSE